MGFRVEITPEAEHDADTILEWLLSQDAGETGVRWFRGLWEAITSLVEQPQRCSLASENAWLPVEMRQLLYGHKPHQYRILFTVRDGVVYIVHIRHGRRQRIVMY